MNTTTTEKQEIDFSIFQFPKLAEAVVDQIGGEESFLASWEDIINHGISGGFSGFIYYAETVDFAKKHIRLIRELAKNQADDFGIGMLEMIKGFRCLNNAYSEDEIGECLWGEGNEDSDQIMNALAWYAVEEICHEFSNSKE